MTAFAAPGKAGRFFWALSARVPGRVLYTLPTDEARALVPELVAIVRRIHALPVADTAGDGLAVATGATRYPTWRAYLEGYEILGDLIDWPRSLADTDPAERRLIERCWEAGRALLHHCPEERALNHGDYSPANILAEAGRITGVIDWGGACHGDPPRDVAWVDFWSPELAFGAAYLTASPPLPRAASVRAATNSSSRPARSASTATPASRRRARRSGRGPKKSWVVGRES